MILSRRVALGGVQLDELHESIVIRSIDPGVPTETIQAANSMGGAGQRVTGAHWEYLEAAVTFAIDVSKRDRVLRREIFDRVLQWAGAKGWLTTSELIDRRMYVDKVIYPSGGDMWNWTDEYVIGFRAYNVPFWQSETLTSITGSAAASGAVTLTVNGTADSVLDATFLNTSGVTINTFTITAGDSKIALSALGLAGGATLKITHGTDGLLRIHAGSTSVYSKYTGTDDLYVSPGLVTVRYTAGAPGVLTVQNFGRWV